MNQKGITKILIAVAAVLILGLGAYFFFTAPQSPDEEKSFWSNLPLIGRRAPLGAEPSPTPSPTSGPQPESPTRQVVDKTVLAPTLSNDGKSLLYILGASGRVASSSLNGDNEIELTTLNLPEVFDAVWSPKKDRVAVSYHENGTVKRLLLGVASGTPSKFLPQETTSLDWSPDGRSIGYLLKRANDTALVIADSGNRNPRTIYNTPVPDFTLYWFSKNTILLVSRPSGLAPSLILAFDAPSARASVLLGGLRGAIVQPLPDASGFLLSQSSLSGQAEALKIFKIKNAESNQLNVVTLAEKCAFGPEAKKLYCGVPSGALAPPMPDEWYKGVVSFRDAVMEVDLATNQSLELDTGGADIDVTSPFVSPDGQYLFFVDKKTSTLWRLTLTKTQESESGKE